MMRGMRPKAIRQMALEAARQRTPRGLMADVIDDLWREQPVPMMRWCASCASSCRLGSRLERSRSWPSSRPTGSVRGRRRVEHVPPSDVAAIFWLKNRDPAHWRDAWQIEGNIISER
jgi:hypothetical protein